ncbi:MAG TPA: hypothetical protein O0X39_03555, partial [Methanocorpusculum sp.]|nr:hypothetical protein [Methanocorpusculum sp.]
MSGQGGWGNFLPECGGGAGVARGAGGFFFALAGEDADRHGSLPGGVIKKEPAAEQKDEAVRETDKIPQTQ